ncbi:MAG TPA: hypothetical protein VD947_01735 [Patescibacteria group bacterium]|nr:hypothetical protein [Patescibacteria group bacterium]
MISGTDPERRQEIKHTMPNSGVDYLFFMNDKLFETDRSGTFTIEHPAPRDISTEQLQVMADDLSGENWDGIVVPVMNGEDIGFGICLKSKD